HWLDRLYRRLGEGLRVNNELAPVGLSTGLAFAPIHGGDGATLLEAADQAMYRVKRSGRGRWSMPDLRLVTPDPPLGGTH
ncbi:MAG: diguanylate cyclase, partial [Pseudomonadota bacterium]